MISEQKQWVRDGFCDMPDAIIIIYNTNFIFFTKEKDGKGGALNYVEACEET